MWVVFSVKPFCKGTLFSVSFELSFLKVICTRLPTSPVNTLLRRVSVKKIEPSPNKPLL